MLSAGSKEKWITGTSGNRIYSCIPRSPKLIKGITGSGIDYKIFFGLYSGFVLWSGSLFPQGYENDWKNKNYELFSNVIGNWKVNPLHNNNDCPTLLGLKELLPNIVDNNGYKINCTWFLKCQNNNSLFINLLRD